MKKIIAYRIPIILGTILLSLIALLAMLLYNGTILLNNPSRYTYPVRGVDVSSYQGEIDWPVLASQDIQFAFIKATEGSSFVDPYFKPNLTAAQQTSLRVGAYHFFSYDSSGKTQAENFIANVPATAAMLPPVVDLEFYGDKEKNLPVKEDVVRELASLLQELEAHYGKRPILYATDKSNRLYLAGEFDEYDLWIRNVVSTPSLAEGQTWTFWQYTNRERLAGYHGKETFIDINVFHGSQAEFDAYGQQLSESQPAS